MKYPTALVIGLFAGAGVASVSLLLWQSKEQAQRESEVRELKEGLSRAQLAVEEAREALRRAKEEREREVARGAAGSAPEATPNRPVPAPAGTAGSAPVLATSNASTMSYLGDAVQAPATLDPKYSAQQLVAAFRGLCEARGVKVGKLGVDGTEFPFVVHGVLEGEKAREFFFSG